MRIAVVAVVAVVAIALGGCGTASSVGAPGEGAGAGDGGATASDGAAASDAPLVIPDAPAGGVLQGRPFTIRSTSLRIEGDRHVLSLHEYASNCGVTQGTPPADSVSVHVVVFGTGPGEETVVYADNHAATFQVGVDPTTMQAFPARRGRVRFDTFSTTVGASISGAIALESDVGNVAGTFTGTVCGP